MYKRQVYGTRTKWNLNPSLGFRWNIGYENFMERLTWLDNMSIRLTWGQVVKYKATRYDVFGTYDIDPDNTCLLYTSYTSYFSWRWFL